MSQHPKILISICGGVCYLEAATCAIEVVYIDHDSLAQGEDFDEMIKPDHSDPVTVEEFDCIVENFRPPKEKCDHCGSMVDEVHPCPSGKDICDTCFERGIQ